MATTATAMTRAGIIDTAMAEVRVAVREWIDRLLDQHGTGRVMFRNRRATMQGSPRAWRTSTR